VLANLGDAFSDISAGRDEGDEEGKTGTEVGGIRNLEETEFLSLLGKSGAITMLAREAATRSRGGEAAYWTSPWILPGSIVEVAIFFIRVLCERFFKS